MAINLNNFFDLSVVDQLEASLVNGASDCFFLFSGPPKFRDLADLGTTANGSEKLAAGGLCPLVFATGFNDPDQRAPRGNLVTIGGNKTISAPATGAPPQRIIDITAGALVTSKPGTSNDVTEKWNFLKRLFYHMITNEDLKAIFGDGGSMYGNEAVKPNAVAPEYKAVWGNFSRSVVYDTPIGILAVALTKGGDILSMKYYQGCVLQSVGPQLTASVNQAIMFSGSRGVRLTYTDVKTFTKTEATGIAGNDDTSGTDYIQALITAKYFTD